MLIVKGEVVGVEKHRCRLVAVEDWKKCGIIMKVESQYLLDDNNVLHENALYILNIRKFVLLVTSIICVAALGPAIITRCMSVVQTTDESECTKATVEVVAEATQEMMSEEVDSIATSKKTIMEKCYTEYLTEEDLYEAAGKDGNLGETLQYLINFIYARNGHDFEEGGIIDSLFQEESWYQEISEKRIVTYENLNRYEQKNIDTMVTILEKEGYR